MNNDTSNEPKSYTLPIAMTIAGTGIGALLNKSGASIFSTSALGGAITGGATGLLLSNLHLMNNSYYEDRAKSLVESVKDEHPSTQEEKLVEAIAKNDKQKDINTLLLGKTSLVLGHNPLNLNLEK